MRQYTSDSPKNINLEKRLMDEFIKNKGRMPDNSKELEDFKSKRQDLNYQTR